MRASKLPGIRTRGFSRDARAQGAPTGLELPLGHCRERPLRNQICLPRLEVGGIHPGSLSCAEVFKAVTLSMGR